MSGQKLLVQTKSESGLNRLASVFANARARRGLVKALQVLSRRTAWDKYLLCRPRGGLNDTLCQIAKCIRYATKHQRHLVIDTERSGLRDRLTEYFCLAHPCSSIVLQLDRLMRQSLSTIEGIYPPYLEQFNLDYEATPVPSKNYRLKGTDLPITFDFTSGYNSPLLIHEQSGGGRASLRALSYVRLNPRIARAIQARISSLPDSYVAVHVRHTDIRVDFRDLFTAMREMVSGKSLLLCTDSLEVREEAERRFSNTRMFSFSSLPQGNQRLHDRPGFTSREVNIDALTDLLALASADILITCRDRRKRHYSGFSYLASALHRRPLLLRALLSP